MGSRLGVVTLVFLFMISSLFPSIEAGGRDAPDSSSLEARSISVSFNLNETTTISWSNLETNDYVLLDILNGSTYEIYRSTSPLNSTNLDSMQPIAVDIEACVEDDDYSSCSGKQHELTWQSSPGTEGTYYYGIVTILPNGSTISELNTGHSQSVGVWEDVHPVWAPLRVSAEYDASNSTTKISWLNADEIGLAVPSNRTVWIWRHLVPVTGNNWSEIDSSIIATLEHNATSYVHQHVGQIEEEAYYSVTYRFDTWEDSRFIGTNTLLEPVIEDNIAPELIGQLEASFNLELGVTNLSWEGGVLEENYTMQVWRSSSEISSLSNSDVELIAELPHNSTNFQHHLATESNGEFWYAITLKDVVGNRISELASNHPRAGPIYETNIGTTLTVPSDLMAENFSPSVTKISWSPISYVSDAIYTVWMSTSGQVTEACLETTCSTVASTNETTIMHDIPEGIERDVWYAVTVEATWAQSSKPYQNDLLISGRNSLTSSIREDTTAPSRVNDFDVSFDGSTRTLTFTWTAIDQNSTYQIWKKAGDWSSQTFWNIESEGWGLVKSVSKGEGEIVSNYQIPSSLSDTVATYAIITIDEYGNQNTNLSAGSVALIQEDMLNPSILLGIITNGSQSASEQVWLSNGMSSSFDGVPPGVSSLLIQSTEPLSAVSCRLLGNQTEATSPFFSAEQVGMNWKCSIDIQSSTMMMEVKALDKSANPTFVVLTLHPIAEQTSNESTDETPQNLIDNRLDESASSELESENNLLRAGFLVLTILLFIVVVLMLVKTRKPSTPKGIPSKAEDGWVDRFLR